MKEEVGKEVVDWEGMKKDLRAIGGLLRDMLDTIGREKGVIEECVGEGEKNNIETINNCIQFTLRNISSMNNVEIGVRRRLNHFLKYDNDLEREALSILNQLQEFGGIKGEKRGLINREHRKYLSREEIYIIQLGRNLKLFINKLLVEESSIPRCLDEITRIMKGKIKPEKSSTQEILQYFLMVRKKLCGMETSLKKIWGRIDMYERDVLYQLEKTLKKTVETLKGI